MNFRNWNHSRILDNFLLGDFVLQHVYDEVGTGKPEPIAFRKPKARKVANFIMLEELKNGLRPKT